MTSDEVLSFLSVSIQKHELQSAIRIMLVDELWSSIVTSKKEDEKNLSTLVELLGIKNRS
jgi:hypothetical protein